ncbi:unnamed protein product [Durusdinium trenchii]|uniref:Uncharacterized protein n=1 Tax=Durusdinium trenchii TaxID=1381693 RepID=A0ABP0NTB4_9DINO
MWSFSQEMGAGTRRERAVSSRSQARWAGWAVCLLGLWAGTEAWVGDSPRDFQRSGRLALNAQKLDTVSPGDRFVGWIRHPVLTSRQKFDLVVEVGPGDNEGAWKIVDPNKKLKARKSYEGPCKVIRYDTGIAFRDLDTVLNGTLNGAGPGTISGRTMQCGLKWGGFFEVKLED